MVPAAVAGIVVAVPRFEVTLGRVGWFGDTVGWLAPEPGRPFRALTPHLPVRAPVASVHLIEGSPEPGSWRTVTEFPLGDGACRPK